jgi:hypothetical protein
VVASVNPVKLMSYTFNSFAGIINEQDLVAWVFLRNNDNVVRSLSLRPRNVDIFALKQACEESLE